MPQQTPLHSLRVLDLSRVLAGPYCTMMLGDLGADIIKIEQPGTGDETRRWGPPYADGSDGERQSAYYLSVNRNKRSLAVDLKTIEGQRIIRELAAQSDIVVENFRQGVLERMGLGYAELSKEHPELIWCTISGYGSVGPEKTLPGFDFVAQAETGIMSITGDVDGSPAKVGVAIVDITTGMYAATAILAALQSRATTQRGQRIEVSLFSSGLAWLANVGQNYLTAGEDSARYGNAHRSIVPYETFRAQDRSFALGVGTDKQFRALCGVAGHPEWGDDDRFATNPARVQHRLEVKQMLDDAFAQQDAATWIAHLRGADIPCGPINTVGEALTSEQAQSLESIVTIEHPTIGDCRLVAPPYQFSETPASVRLPPPILGQHSAFILREYVHYDNEYITLLQERGIIQ